MMEINSFSTQEIEVTAVYFRKGQTGLESYPRRMVYEGREYNFLEEGLRYLVKTKNQLVKLFDVSDGELQYRLRLDNANRWTLVGIKSGL
jgi:hypothetical protein